jgi:hypothetical protein
MTGRVSGLPIERYLGIDPTSSLPIMICQDHSGRHWVTDGTRSVVIYPDQRAADAPDGTTLDFDYSVERASALLSIVDPITRSQLPYDDLVHANWLILATHDLLLEYPRGSLAVDRVAIDRDSPTARTHLRVKVQGANKGFKTHRLLPKRTGHFNVEAHVLDDTTVVLEGSHTILDVHVNDVYPVIRGQAREQSREIVDRILNFIWECRSYE